MTGKWKKVETYLVILYCDVCKEEMELKAGYLTYPKNYLYKCPNCGHEYNSNEVFPRIDYRVKNGKDNNSKNL